MRFYIAGLITGGIIGAIAMALLIVGDDDEDWT